MLDIIITALDERFEQHTQRVLQRILQLEELIMSAITDLQDAETANEAQVAAVVTEINTLVAQLGQASPDDSATIAAITARITAGTAALAAAVNSASLATTTPTVAPTAAPTTSPVDPTSATE